VSTIAGRHASEELSLVEVTIFENSSATTLWLVIAPVSFVEGAVFDVDDMTSTIALLSGHIDFPFVPISLLFRRSRWGDLLASDAFGNWRTRVVFESCQLLPRLEYNWRQILSVGDERSLELLLCTRVTCQALYLGPRPSHHALHGPAYTVDLFNELLVFLGQSVQFLEFGAGSCLCLKNLNLICFLEL